MARERASQGGHHRCLAGRAITGGTVRKQFIALEWIERANDLSKRVTGQLVHNHLCYLTKPYPKQESTGRDKRDVGTKGGWCVRIASEIGVLVRGGVYVLPLKLMS